MDLTLGAKVQWLMDRIAIDERLCSLARALDTKNYQAYADNYVDGGCIELPASLLGKGTLVLHKHDMLERVPKTFQRYSGTQHLVANHEIDIDGDAASSRAYLHAVHVGGALTDHWTGGGLYQCEYVRTVEGWKFTRVRLTRMWLDGQLPPAMVQDVVNSRTT